MGQLLIRQDGAVRIFSLNRPRSLNALSGSLLVALDEAVTRAIEDEGTRVVVLAGTGDQAFCAGADLDELMSLSRSGAEEYLALGHRLMRRLEQARLPSIAAVHGLALGGGFELALACSCIVASTSASFGLPEARLGLIPGLGGTQRLVRAIGRGPALRLMLAGERLGADEAAALGLLCIPPVPDDAPATAVRLASRMAESGPAAVRSILAAVSRTAPTDEDLRHEARLAADAMVSQDGRDGMAAFRNHRTPPFANA